MVTLGVKCQETNEIVNGLQKEWSGDVVVFCPVCKAMQTLAIVEDTMLPTRKFTQIGDRIFHDCSSGRPCRLYRTL
jgi:hypothetical protein